MVIILNKKEGETPLQATERFRLSSPRYKDAKMTYAGRLDPMASGLLIVLVGDETKNKEKYLKLKKEYEFEVLFGFSTDTYDILGKVLKTKELKENKKELAKLVKDNLKYFKGRFEQKYPIYSSKAVDGKPLFSYARSNKRVVLPSHEVSVSSLKFFNIKTISSANLLQNIEKRITKLEGDFRQKEIIKIWQKYLRGNKAKYEIASFKIKCGSGTYVRSIANDLGHKIHIPALAYSIKRTKIGNWRQEYKSGVK